MFKLEKKMTCNNLNQYQLLSKITNVFVKIWLNTINLWDIDLKRINNQIKFDKSFDLDVLKLIEKIKIKKENVFESEKIRDFMIDPINYIENNEFLSLNWSERIIAIYLLVRKNCLISKIDCFCKKTLLTKIKSKSSKKKNELIRPFLKKYIELIIDLILPRHNLLLSKTEKKKKFNKLIKKNLNLPYNDILKFYFNEIPLKKNKIKTKRTKSIKDLIIILKNNKVTSKYFSKEGFLNNIDNFKNLILPERNIKIEKFLINFKNVTILELFNHLKNNLTNKKIKLFMNKQDLDALFYCALNSVQFQLKKNTEY